MYVVEIDIIDDWNAIFRYETIEECLPMIKMILEQGYGIKFYYEDEGND